MGVLHMLAAGNPGEQIGNNIKDLALGIAGPLFIAGFAIIVLSLFGARKIAELAIVFVVALVISVPIFNSDAFVKIVKSIGNAILS